MRKMRGLFVGLTTIDIQYFVDSFPKPNKKIKTNPPEIITGGPATNAAVAFSKLGGDSFLASATGENSFDTFVNNDFSSAGIKHINLTRRQKTNPVLATVITQRNNGDRTIFTHNPAEISSGISAETLITNVKPDVLLLDGFHPEFAVDAAREAKKLNVPIVLDCGSWKPQYEKLIEHASVVICSEDFYPPKCKTADDVFTFLKNNNVRQAAVSRGEKSILFFNRTDSGEITVNNTNVIDTLAAGDFLHGAFCYYYRSDNNFIEALKKASQIASKSCEYPGTRSWLNSEI